MVGSGVALVPDEDGFLQLVGGGPKDGQPDRKLGHELGVVGRVHLQNIFTSHWRKNFHFLHFEIFAIISVLDGLNQTVVEAEIDRKSLFN